jgi:hypothetical protein
MLVFSIHGILVSCILLMRLNVYLLSSMPVAYQVCSVNARVVLWNWLCFTLRLGACVLLSGVVFQISAYTRKYRCLCPSCVIR